MNICQKYSQPWTKLSLTWLRANPLEISDECVSFLLDGLHLFSESRCRCVRDLIRGKMEMAPFLAPFGLELTASTGFRSTDTFFHGAYHDDDHNIMIQFLRTL